MTVRRQPARRTFTIVELDDMGAPHGPAVVHTSVFDVASATMECVFRLPDTDEHYRFYYAARAGHTWDDSFPDGNVLCTRVTSVAVLTHQWRPTDQKDDIPLHWDGTLGRRTPEGVRLPLRQGENPVGELLLDQTETDHLIRTLGGTPRTHKPATGMMRASAAAVALGVSQRTLAHWREHERIPYERTPGGHYLYDVDAVREAIEEELAQYEQQHVPEE